MRLLTTMAVIAGLALWASGPLSIAYAQTEEEPATAAPTTKKTKKAEAAPAASELEQRVAQLEEQLVDMQVVIGTLESLARSRGSLPSGDGGDPAQMQVMETQLQALAAQVQQLTQQVSALSGKSVPASGPSATAGESGSIVEPLPPLAEGSVGTSTGTVASSDDGFGDATVSSGGLGDAIGSLIAGGESAPAEATPGEAAPAEEAPAAGTSGKTASVEGGGPEKDYEEAYGQLLQQQYDGAEIAFRDFLVRYPDNPLAGNAQYWLGETYYVRGQYKPAAEAFLAGYDKYKKAQKAPDSLLKLAMSLSRLGQKESACSAFTTLDTQYPKASAQLKRRAQTERERAGC